jgi:hypothetical protein
MTSEQYEKWANENGFFISKVIKRLFLGKLGGFYILNSYKFNWFPKFYGAFRKYWVECGVSWLGYIFEYQYNR